MTNPYVGLFKGLWLTFKYQFRRPITLQYPFEEFPVPPNFRGFLKLEGVVGEPDKIPERSEVLPPCAQGCPAHVDACGYINLVATGNVLDGYYLHMLSNPLPAVYGRICYAPCQPVCRRGGEEEPIQIRAIKKYMTDKVFEMFDSGEAEPPKGPPFELDDRIAVVGSGPAGLSCAYYLRQMGYQVTIYEKEEVPGGMLALGIPEYRLPRDILKREIDIILATGVSLELNKALGRDYSIDGLFEQGYKSVFLGVGAHIPQKLGTKGEDEFPEVMAGETFLKEVALGRAPHAGKRVAIVGAGNTAMDCSRVARRLGAEVHVLYRRSRKEAPALPHEIEEAEVEGVIFDWQVAPLGFSGENGKLKTVELIKTELGPPDARGRRSPVEIEGSQYSLEVDLVLTAISRMGSWCELGPKDEGWLGGTGVSCAVRGNIEVDALTNVTTRPGVFAGGDASRGPTTAIEAIGDGHRAALAIDTWLRTGENLPQDIAPREPIKEKTRFHPREVPAVKPERIPPAVAVQSFEEDELTYTDAQAKLESERCLSCMTRACIGCAICAQACPDKCITMEILQDDEKRIIDEFNILHHLCCYCGLCTEACPTKTLVHTTERDFNPYDVAALNFDRQKMLRTTEPKPVAPDGMQRWPVYRKVSKHNPGGGHLPFTLQGTHPGSASVTPMKPPQMNTEFAYQAPWRRNEADRMTYELEPGEELEKPTGSQDRLWDDQYPPDGHRE